MAGNEDYFMRHVELLRQFLAQAIKLRSDGQADKAMMVLMQAQEKLFELPIAEVSGLNLDEQLQRLAKDLPAPQARERQLGYALLLKEAGLCFADRDRPEVAANAFKTALHILLRIASEGETAPDSVTMSMARALLARIPPERIDEPIRELLAAVAARCP
jgi:hypothetical protein